MKIAAFAKLVNISTDTLRYYEKIGLLHPQHNRNGYRDYTDADAALMKFITNLRHAQLKLPEVKQAVALYQSPKSNYCDKETLKLVTKKAQDCQQQAIFYTKMTKILAELKNKIEEEASIDEIENSLKQLGEL